MPRPTTFDATGIITALHRRDVQFVVIGGLAAAANGVVWATFDVDVVIEVSDANMRALAEALEGLAAEYHTPHNPPIRPDLKRLSSLPGPQLFRTRLGRLDVLKEAGGETYESLLTDAHTAVLEGYPIRYAGLRALLRMKRVANRRKDTEGIRLIEEALRAGPDPEEG